MPSLARAFSTESLGDSDTLLLFYISFIEIFIYTLSASRGLVIFDTIIFANPKKEVMICLNPENLRLH